ncbi:MAG: hypothetical protein K0Q58_1523 [Microbacterium sp.]|nr:hypothetical protein [Microbacterium sp.]
MAESPRPVLPVKIMWLARLERRFHSWRERRARARGLTPTVSAFPGYGSETWVRVLGRVVIAPAGKRGRTGDYSGVRGWRSFAAVPVGFAQVTVSIDGIDHQVVADRGGVIDTVLPATLAPGWQEIRAHVERGEATVMRVLVVADDTTFGVVSDVDDTVMVTALPRPFLAAWNSFAHKSANLNRLAEEFPNINWLLIGDDGQHDEAIYTAFAAAHPTHVAAVAIRQLTPAEAVLAGGRSTVDDHSAASVPWVTGGDGAHLLDRLGEVGVLNGVEGPA